MRTLVVLLNDGTKKSYPEHDGAVNDSGALVVSRLFHRTTPQPDGGTYHAYEREDTAFYAAGSWTFSYYEDETKTPGE